MRVSRPDHPTSCGLFVPLSVAGALMMFVATAVNLYPVWLERQGIRGGGTGLNAQIPAVDGAARTEEYVPLTGLIDPHCGDQCTDPAQTKTGGCGLVELYSHVYTASSKQCHQSIYCCT